MEGVLPEDRADAAIVNAAAMELGATVCTARSPRCDACPLAEICRWRAEGFPASPDLRRRQARYEGSDRHARGAVLGILRGAAPDDVDLAALLAEWPDARQRDRAIDSLVADGLVEVVADRARLPR